MPWDFVEYSPLHPRPAIVSGTAGVTSPRRRRWKASSSRRSSSQLFTTKSTNLGRLSAVVYLTCTLFFSSLHFTSLSPPGDSSL